MENQSILYSFSAETDGGTSAVDWQSATQSYADQPAYFPHQMDPVDAKASSEHTLHVAEWFGVEICRNIQGRICTPPPPSQGNALYFSKMLGGGGRGFKCYLLF